MVRFIKILLFTFSIISSIEAVDAQIIYKFKPHPSASTRTANEVAPVLTREGMIFISDKETGGIQKRRDIKNQKFTNLYITNLSEAGSWSNEKSFSKNLKTNHHDGPISFNFNEDKAVFTRNFELPGFGNDKGGNPNFGLFFAEFDGNNWVNITEFEYNDHDYHTTHPSLSPMGDLLYFASDRPDGFGGYDIYLSRNQNGVWSKPENLGPVVNSSENEIYPFLHACGRIYFSSNGHDDRKDYDIFYTDFFEGKWFRPIKLPPPFNSGTNDFTFYTDENYEGGLFSSNRRGSIDVFTFETDLPKFDFCKKQVENNYCYLFYEENTVSMDTSLYAYEWNLGDGAKIRAVEAEHCYLNPGDYLVKLNVVDRLTNIVEFNQAEYMVEVRKVIQPYISCLDMVSVDQDIQINGAESYLGEVNPGEYYWDFGDGEKAIGERVRHTFLSPGQFIIKLGIVEENNNTETPQQFCAYKTIIVKE